jgi:hypothetical protein
MSLSLPGGGALILEVPGESILSIVAAEPVSSDMGPIEIREEQEMWMKRLERQIALNVHGKSTAVKERIILNASQFLNFKSSWWGLLKRHPQTAVKYLFRYGKFQVNSRLVKDGDTKVKTDLKSFFGEPATKNFVCTWWARMERVRINVKS